MRLRLSKHRYDCIYLYKLRTIIASSVDTPAFLPVFEKLLPSSGFNTTSRLDMTVRTDIIAELKLKLNQQALGA